MNRTVIALALMASVSPVAARDESKAERYKCSQETRVCVRKMAQTLSNKGWVGIEMTHDTSTDTMTVRKVIEGSPAEAAGFKPGDVMAALNGIPYTLESKAALKKAYSGLNPGDKVVYTVHREGSEVDLTVELANIPEALRAQWIGRHMLEGHAHEEEEEAEEGSP